MSRDYRFIALTYLLGVILGLSIPLMSKWFVLVGNIGLFVFWGFCLFAYMRGED